MGMELLMKYEKPEDIDHLNWQSTEELVRSPTNRRKTLSLFIETINPAQFKKYGPVMTLAEKPKWDYLRETWLPSAKQIFVLSNSEYEGAMKLVGSMEHWNMLLDCDWFVNGKEKDASFTSLTQWKKEQQDRIASLAQTHLLEAAMAGNVTAIKALLYGNSAGPKRGRPSKEEVKGELKKQTREEQSVQSDKDRILRLVRGN